VSVQLPGGTSSYLDRSGTVSPAIGGDTAFTMAARVRFNALTSYTWVMGFFGNGDENSITIDAGGTSLNNIIKSGATYYTISQGSITVNTWYHVVFTWNGTTSQVYINGTSIGTLAAAPTGRAAWPSFGFGYCDGSIQDAVLYNTAISGAEAAALYARRFPARRLNMVAWYPFFPGTARTTDFSGNGNTLTPHGSPADGAEGPVGYGAPGGRAFKASNLDVPLIGATSMTSAGAGVVTVGHALVGGADTTVAIDGQLSVAQALAGASPQTVAATGVIGLVYGLTGTSAAASSATGALIVGVLPAGDAPQTTSATAPMALARALVGAAPAGTFANAVIANSVGLTDTAATATAATGAMNMDMPIGAGSSASTAASTGQLNLTRPFDGGNSLAASDATAVLTVAVGLVGTAPAGTFASGGLNSTGFNGVVASAASATGALSLIRGVAGTAPSAVAASGILDVAVSLTGAAAITTTATGAEVIYLGFVATTAAAKSAAGAVMTVTMALTGMSDTRVAANAYTRSAPLPQQFLRVPAIWNPTVIRLTEGDS
jgi:hypothetical protein